VYVLLRPQKPPFLLALARIPAACFPEPQGCPSIAIIHQNNIPDESDQEPFRKKRISGKGRLK
jgi:hypothetical protein